MLIPLFFSLYYSDSDSGAFGASIGISIGTGLLFFFITRTKERAGISRREALALVVFSYLVASFFGALPYHFAGTFDNFLNSFFESISGFTTTGASVMTSIESEPHGILLWRDLTQWLGGMGIIVLFVSLFPLLGVGAAYLFEAEAPGPEVQRLRTHIRDTSRTIWLIYIGLSALEVILLLTVGNLSFFDSLSNAFGTVATGGFSPKDGSIGAYDSLAVNVIIIGFMFMAGINFALYYGLLWRRSLRGLWENSELRLYVTLLVGASLLIACDLIVNGDYSTGKAFEEAAFNSTSIQTTTGFAVSDFDAWPSFSRLALLTMMIVGACAGSTGGALKVIRVTVLFKYAYRQIVMVFNPQAVMPLRMGGKVISEKIISRVIGFTILYLAFLFVGTLIMAALEGDFTTAIASVIATVGNIGPGLGLVGPAENYAGISAGGKAVLMICMLAGRLEIMTILALLTPAFWRWR